MPLSTLQKPWYFPAIIWLSSQYNYFYFISLPVMKEYWQIKRVYLSENCINSEINFRGSMFIFVNFLRLKIRSFDAFYIRKNIWGISYHPRKTYDSKTLEHCIILMTIQHPHIKRPSRCLALHVFFSNYILSWFFRIIQEYR